MRRLPSNRLLAALLGLGEQEIGDLFEQLGLVRVRTKSVGTIQWVRGQKP